MHQSHYKVVIIDPKHGRDNTNPTTVLDRERVGDFLNRCPKNTKFILHHRAYGRRLKCRNC